MKKYIATIIIGAALIGGCKKSDWAHTFQGFGNRFDVTLYSGGQMIGHWISDGQVQDSKSSDGYYFVTIEGELVQISGEVIIRE